MTQEAKNATSGAPQRGMFITFEGGEGAGKSTHIAFLAYCLREQGYKVICLREPGGTKVGEQLREIVLDTQNTDLSSEAELLIYEAARAQIVSTVIAPALEEGAVVLCDRFFDSTIAYQAFGRGLSRAFVEEANAFACQGVCPNRTILMTSATAEEGLSRATNEGADRLELESVDFHQRVNEAFAQLAREYPERIRVVRFAEKRSDTARAVFAQLAGLFSFIDDELLENAAYFERVDDDALRASLQTLAKCGDA